MILSNDFQPMKKPPKFIRHPRTIALLGISVYQYRLKHQETTSKQINQTEHCLSDAELFALNHSDSQNYKKQINHLAHCATCYQRWLILASPPQITPLSQKWQNLLQVPLRYWQILTLLILIAISITVVWLEQVFKPAPVPTLSEQIEENYYYLLRMKPVEFKPLDEKVVLTNHHNLMSADKIAFKAGIAIGNRQLTRLPITSEMRIWMNGQHDTYLLGYWLVSIWAITSPSETMSSHFWTQQLTIITGLQAGLLQKSPTQPFTSFVLELLAILQPLLKELQIHPVRHQKIAQLHHQLDNIIMGIIND